MVNALNYRHEIKHLITPADAVAIRANLNAVARVDPNAAQNGGHYLIHSLYFDDLCDTALHEKLDGVNQRKKYRIRYYNDDLSYIVLECKIKQDGVGAKPQERLTQEEAERILSGDIGWMVTSGKPLLASLYVDMKIHGLRPKVVVEYKRLPYVYPPGNVRVTIDWNIRTAKPNQFFASNPLTLPIQDNVMLLEVKWDEYLPSIIRQAVALKSRQGSAFSKYAACRVYF